MAELRIQGIGMAPGVVYGNRRPGVSPRAETLPATSAPSRGDSVSFSPEALAASRTAEEEARGSDIELTEEEQVEVQELKQRDREVRQHEQAHVAAGGQYVQGGPSYEFTTGPDGRRYATGGEVSISVSPERTPEASLRKARIVRRAALAPAEPSAQDRRVAAQASQLEARARREIAEARQNSAGTEGASGASSDLQGIDTRA